MKMVNSIIIYMIYSINHVCLTSLHLQHQAHAEPGIRWALKKYLLNETDSKIIENNFIERGDFLYYMTDKLPILK